MTRIALMLVCSLAAVAWLGVHVVQGDGAPARAPASAIYPALAQPVAMNHSTPAHRALTCDHCHKARAQHAQGREDYRPSEAVCAQCHADRTARAQPSRERCGYCHRGFDPLRVTAPEPVPLRATRLHFAHARHASLECGTCHARHDASDASDTNDAGATPGLPNMSNCLQCHQGRRALPCGGCHLTTPSGRLRTVFGDAKLIPRSAFLGMAHDADFSVRHRWVAADQGAVCATCHVESECSGCHDGARKPRSLHPNDYLALHAQDSQRNATRCNSCHSSASFCLACHARLGIAEISAPDLSAPRRFHPSSSLWIRGPMLHAREAQRSLASCVSCHAERDCVACHGARGVGTGLRSPHPPGFATGDCARDFARNARACLICHRASDVLLRNCR